MVGKKQLLVKIPEDLYKRVEETGKPKVQIVTEALNLYFDDPEDQENTEILEEQVSFYQDQMTLLKEINEDLEGKLQDLGEEHNKALDDLENIQVLRDDNSTMVQRIAILEEQVKAHISRIDDLKQHNQDLKEQLQDNKEELQKAHDKHQDLQRTHQAFT